MVIRLCIIFVIVSLNGCATNNPLSTLSLEGPKAILPSDQVEVDEINSGFITEVDAQILSHQTYLDETAPDERDREDYWKAVRNNIQDKIIRASINRCGRYKLNIKRFDGVWNSTLGGLSIISATAGALYRTTSVAKIFSATAAALTGIKTEVNQSFFNEKVIQLLTKAIDERRKTTMETILAHRKSKTVLDYSIMNAVNDAVYYHNQCSLNVGLEEADDSIQRVNNPGLIEFQKTLGRFKHEFKIKAVTETTGPEENTVPEAATESGT